MSTIGGKPLGIWEKTTEEAYEFALGAVPPESYLPGGFLLGEPYSSTPEGLTVWRAYVRRAGLFYGFLTTKPGLESALSAAP